MNGLSVEEIERRKRVMLEQLIEPGSEKWREGFLSGSITLTGLGLPAETVPIEDYTSALRARLDVFAGRQINVFSAITPAALGRAARTLGIEGFLGGIVSGASSAVKKILGAAPEFARRAVEEVRSGIESLSVGQGREEEEDEEEIPGGDEEEISGNEEELFLEEE